MPNISDNLISILMPVKNVASYIEECIQSVIDQTTDDWELIITDDHSIDDTGSIIKDFTDKEKRIKLLQNKGSGIIDALQSAYEVCQGQFITRMDGDDLMYTNKLEMMRDSLIHKGEGFLAVGQVSYFSDTSLGQGYINYEKWLNDLIAQGKIWKDIYKECVVPSPCWMAFRSDFEKAGAFNSTLYPEDYDLAFRFYNAGLAPIPCRLVLHKWRDYENRTSRTHPNYQDNTFLDLKCHYFIELDHDPEKSLVIWGAGKKGKKIARYFIDKKIQFMWISNNPNKIGHDIFGINIQDEALLSQLQESQMIIAVANPDEQAYIKNTLTQHLNSKTLQAYYFC